MMSRRLARVLLALLGTAVLASCTPTASRGPLPRAQITDALAGPADAGFERALRPRSFQFPADAGPHPSFQTEWWYYTGNLEDAEGRHFGYQLTFFRRALVPKPLGRSSRWAASAVYFAHFTVTDVADRRFRAAERWSREALGLAGARAEPFAAWVEDWSARAEGSTTRLTAAADGTAIDLRLAAESPVLPQGDHGLSRKGLAEGNASYYYSVPRLRTDGTIEVGGRVFRVRGTSWLDREWSTSALDPDDEGWDWFALHLADGRSLMLYMIRRRDGRPEPVSSGMLVSPEGTGRPLRLADFQIDVTGRWTSPRGGTYPSGWRVRVPSAGLDLRVTPWLADQELPLSIRYWEGAVKVEGGTLSGNGYVELTGYAGRESR